MLAVFRMAVAVMWPPPYSQNGHSTGDRRHGGHAVPAAVLADDASGVALQEIVVLLKRLRCLSASFGGCKCPKATTTNTCFCNSHLPSGLITSS